MSKIVCLNSFLICFGILVVINICILNYDNLIGNCRTCHLYCVITKMTFVIKVEAVFICVSIFTFSEMLVTEKVSDLIF